jgi:hypothetical protein
MPEATPKPKLRYEDAPSLPETFSDSITAWRFDGSVLRIEFAVSRMDTQKGSGQRTGRMVPVSRLILTPTAAIELVNRCRQFSEALEKAGLLKKKSSDEHQSD